MNAIVSKARKASPFQVIAFGFAALVLFGTALLCLPISKTNPASGGFLEALFTSCSAVCVTGLVVVNTGTYWSAFGKTVVLVLVQLGGLGVVTAAVAATTLTRRRIGLRQRDLMRNAVNAPKLGGIVRFARFVVVFALVAEGIGALLIAPSFFPDYGIVGGFVMAVFHSASAFCNAGFDVLDAERPFASMVSYAGDVRAILVVSALVVAGGLGFFTWEDLLAGKFRWKNLRTQTKLILSATALLIFVPAAFYFLSEFTEGTVSERILSSLFQSVTARTAGFASVDEGGLSDATKATTIVLMLIGGSPGSTAGGIKTTTAAALFLELVGNVAKRGETRAFGRSISKRSLSDARTILFLYLIAFLFGSLALCLLENLPILDCSFECASALGTVGLTTGITPTLSVASKIILTFFMYFGRVGALTLVYAAFDAKRPDAWKSPEVEVMIG